MRFKASTSTPARRKDRRERNNKMISRDKGLRLPHVQTLGRQVQPGQNLQHTRLSRTPSASSASSSTQIKLFLAWYVSYFELFV